MRQFTNNYYPAQTSTYKNKLVKKINDVYDFK